MSADDDVDPRRPLEDLSLILLREAAGDDDPHRGVAVLQRPQVAQVPVEPVVGVLADRAGVENHDIGFLEPLRSG